MTEDLQAGGTRPPMSSVLGELSGALDSARAALLHFLELLTLEARRAGLALVWMAASGLAAAICLASGWLGLMGACATIAYSLGVPALAAIIAVSVLNLLAAAALVNYCIHTSRDLLFSATQRQLAGVSAVKPPAAP